MLSLRDSSSSLSLAYFIPNLRHDPKGTLNSNRKSADLDLRGRGHLD